MNQKENKKRENKLGFSVFIASIIVCVLAVSYAIWTQAHEGQQINKMDTATLIFSLDETASDGISLLNTVPMLDTKGEVLTPYKFSIKNSGSIDANYRVMLVNDNEKYAEDNCTNNKLDWTNIKYSIAKENELSTKGNLGEAGGVIGSGTIKSGETISYDLRLWIKSEATSEIMNQHFHGLIKVEAIQGDQTLS